MVLQQDQLVSSTSHACPLLHTMMLRCPLLPRNAQVPVEVVVVVVVTQLGAVVVVVVVVVVGESQQSRRPPKSKHALGVSASQQYSLPPPHVAARHITGTFAGHFTRPPRDAQHAVPRAVALHVVFPLVHTKTLFSVWGVRNGHREKLY